LITIIFNIIIISSISSSSRGGGGGGILKFHHCVSCYSFAGMTLF